MHILDDKYPTRPGCEPTTSEFRAKSHRGRPRNVNSVCAETHVSVPHWDLLFSALSVLIFPFVAYQRLFGV